MMKKLNQIKLAVIGLGYVGLPLCLEYAKKREVVGFDINKKRISELKSGIDKNLQHKKKELKIAKNLILTSEIKDLKFSNCYIVTVPTPIKKNKTPDLKFLVNASKMIGGMIKKKDIIIYESTVYPGCLEEVCVPILEKFSSLKFNCDFFCGYSPERINPGDKKYTISKIKKITSGSTPEIAKLIDDLYNEIITVGTHKADSIKIAEAAKVIENIQRDLNIALINELSLLFRKMNIDTHAVLNAAGTKWNFLPFRPGLVGGHCIGVDPYYLTYKAKSIGYTPKVILAGRKLNDSMGIKVATNFVKLIKKKLKLNKPKILIMGATFKENCPDIRNSGVKVVFNKLKKFNCDIDLHDPVASKEDIFKFYKVNPIFKLNLNTYDAILISVAHNRFKKMGISNIKKLCKKNNVIFDLKNIFNSDQVDMKL